MTRSGLPSPFTSDTVTNVTAARRRRRLAFGEGPVAVAQEDADGLVVEVRDDQVGPAVAVDVGAAANDIGASPRRKRGEARERAVAVAEQHRRCSPPSVRHDDVELAVAVEVAAERPRTGGPAGESLLGSGTCRCRCRAARARVAVVVGGDDVGAAVAVDVRGPAVAPRLTPSRSVCWGPNRRRCPAAR